MQHQHTQQQCPPLQHPPMSKRALCRIAQRFVCKHFVLSPKHSIPNLSATALTTPALLQLVKTSQMPIAEDHWDTDASDIEEKGSASGSMSPSDDSPYLESSEMRAIPR